MNLKKEEILWIVEAWCSIYNSTIEELKGTFKPEELKLLINSYKGITPNPKEYGKNDIVDNVLEYIHREGIVLEEIGINQVNLLNKLDILISYLDAFCLLKWIYNYWNYNNPPIEEYVKELV